VGLPRNHQHNGNTINVQPVRGTNRHVITITGADFRSLPRVSRLEDAGGDAELGVAITGMLRSVLPNHRFV
jgi:hypothetical protein